MSAEEGCAVPNGWVLPSRLTLLISINGRRWWFAFVFAGALTVTTLCGYLDIGLNPPEYRSTALRALLWPVDLLLLGAGDGPQFPSGGYEWTLVHQLATAIGYGAAWAFWVTIARVGWRTLGPDSMGWIRPESK